MGPATAAAARQQEEEQLLAACLSLLDIKQADGARLVDISPVMFRKPNAKAFELILYHAYCIVKGKAAAKKSFRGLWPLVDKDRKQSKDFYQKIQEWLKESGQLTDPSLAAFQRNPSGAKLVCFLCDLVHWALEVQHARMYPDDAVQQPPLEDSALLVALAEPLLTAAEAHNKLQVERLLRLCQEGAQMQQQAEQTASHLKEVFYELTAQLREARSQEDAAPAQPPSIRLASILPAQATDADSLQAAATSSMPAPLQQQVHEVQQLWQQLQQYLQDFAGLRSMVQHLVGSAAHPYAIDALQLRAYGQAGGLGGSKPAPAAALDIAALVEAWLFDVGSVCRYVKTLAGHAANLDQQQDNQQRGWLPVKPPGVGVGRCSFMSPLVATSDAASHATHLYAQLSLHRACRDGLLGLQTTLRQQADDAAARMQALQAELTPLIDQQVEQASAAADAAAAAAAAMEPGGAADLLDASQPAGQPAGDWSQGGLFTGGHMQLIPPTPMLQQQQQRRQQARAAEQQGPAAHSTRTQPRPPHLAPPLTLQGNMGHSSAAGPASAAAAVGVGASCSDDAALASPVLLPAEAGGASSPELCASPIGSLCSSSGASSVERPAAELLMSRELMDLDLVEEEEGDALADLDDGGVFATHSHTAYGRSGQGRGSAHMARISYARFSLGTDSLSPLLAAARGEQLQAAAAGRSEAPPDGGGAGGGGCPSDLALALAGEGSGSMGGALEGDASWLSSSVAGEQPQAAQPAAEQASGRQQQQQGPGGCSGESGELACGAPGVAVSSGELGLAAAAAAASSEAAASSGVASASRSPRTQQQPVGAHNPMAPMSAGSAECMSSAKPRRLTFAAAATSMGSCGTAGLLGGAKQPQLSDAGSSFSISSGEEGGEVAESAAAAVEAHQPGPAANALAALRQRFAETQGRQG